MFETKKIEKGGETPFVSLDDICIASNYDGFLIQVRFDEVSESDIFIWENSKMYIANFLIKEDVFGFVFNMEILFTKPPFVLYEPAIDENMQSFINNLNPKTLSVTLLLVDENNIIKAMRKIVLSLVHANQLINYIKNKKTVSKIPSEILANYDYIQDSIPDAIKWGTSVFCDIPSGPLN